MAHFYAHRISFCVSMAAHNAVSILEYNAIRRRGGFRGRFLRGPTGRWLTEWATRLCAGLWLGLALHAAWGAYRTAGVAVDRGAFDVLPAADAHARFLLPRVGSVADGPAHLGCQTACKLSTGYRFSVWGAGAVTAEQPFRPGQRSARRTHG